MKQINQVKRTDDAPDLDAGDSFGQFDLFSKQIELSYNNLGEWENITRKSTGTLTGTTYFTAITSDYEYDGLGRTAKIRHDSPISDSNITSYGLGINGAFNEYTYQYDVLNRITQMGSMDGVTNYTYDAADQLRNADHDVEDASSVAPPDEHYETDLNGNRFERGTGTTYYDVETDADNQVVDDGLYEYTYNAEGNRTSRIRKTEDSGKNDNYVYYYYDARQRLTKVEFRSSASLEDDSNIISTVDYGYDAFNRRNWRQETTWTSGSPNTSTASVNRYVYDGSDVIIDHFWFSASTSYTGEVMRYLWAPHMNAGETSLLLSYEYINGTPALTQVNWTLADHQNSIRDVVRATSDTTLQHVGHHVFDSFGNITWVYNALGTGVYTGDAAKTAALGRYLYTSQEYDAGTGLYCFAADGGMRWYDAGTGTFTTQDPIGFRGLDTNLYRYVRNNSMNFTDPSGLSDLPAGQMYNKAGGPPVGTVYNKGKGGSNVQRPRANGEGQNGMCPVPPNNGGYDPAEANREMDRVNANAANADARKAQTIKNNPGVDAQDGVFDYAVDMAVGLSDGADRGATVYLNALTLGKIDSLNQQATAYQQEALNKGWTMETIGYVGANASATATQGLIIIGGD